VPAVLNNKPKRYQHLGLEPSEDVPKRPLEVINLKVLTFTEVACAVVHSSLQTQPISRPVHEIPNRISEVKKG